MCAWQTMILLEYGREIIVGIVVNKLNIEINKSVYKIYKKLYDNSRMSIFMKYIFRYTE